MCVKTEKEFRKFTNPSLSWRHSTTNSLTDILTEYSSTLCLSMCMHPYAIPMSQWHYSDVSKFPISAQQEVNTSMVLRTNKPKRFISMMGTIFYMSWKAMLPQRYLRSHFCAHLLLERNPCLALGLLPFLHYHQNPLIIPLTHHQGHTTTKHYKEISVKVNVQEISTAVCAHTVTLVLNY